MTTCILYIDPIPYIDRIAVENAKSPGQPVKAGRRVAVRWRPAPSIARACTTYMPQSPLWTSWHVPCRWSSTRFQCLPVLTPPPRTSPFCGQSQDLSRRCSAPTHSGSLPGSGTYRVWMVRVVAFVAACEPKLQRARRPWPGASCRCRCRRRPRRCRLHCHGRRRARRTCRHCHRPSRRAVALTPPAPPQSPKPPPQPPAPKPPPRPHQSHRQLPADAASCRYSSVTPVSRAW